MPNLITEDQIEQALLQRLRDEPTKVLVQGRQWAA